MATEITLGEIGQIAVYVSDLGAAKRFYGEQLGLRHLFDAPPGMAFYQAGATRLLLGAAPPGQSVAPPSVLQFRVADNAGAHRALEARGVRFRAPPHLVHRASGRELWLAEFDAPDGGAHALMEERVTPAT